MDTAHKQATAMCISKTSRGDRERERERGREGERERERERVSLKVRVMHCALR
jgi:hypothetical protein